MSSMLRTMERAICRKRGIQYISPWQRHRRLKLIEQTARDRATARGLGRDLERFRPKPTPPAGFFSKLYRRAADAFGRAMRVTRRKTG